jgi:hypothetical protein
MNQFFCVTCGQLTEVDQASMVFRTGYFRVEYRLGCCAACTSERERVDTANESSDESASSFKLTASAASSSIIPGWADSLATPSFPRIV